MSTAPRTVAKDPVRINGLVSLLEDHGSIALDDLRARFPEYAADLRSGALLGSRTENARRKAGVTKQSPGLAWIEVASSALRVAVERSRPNADRVRARLALAKNLRLVGSIVATLTGAGLIGSLSAQLHGPVTVATAVVNFVATLFTLVANHLEASLYGGRGTLFDLFVRMTKLTPEAEQLLQELLVHGRTDPNAADALECVRRANVLATELRTIEENLWGPSDISRRALRRAAPVSPRLGGGGRRRERDHSA
jgi:hypothetical protein